MAEQKFYLRYSNRTFEHYSGHGYVDSGGTPARLIPLEKLWSLHISAVDDIYDENGQVIGIRFRNCEDGSLHDVFPGKVYNLPVWTTAVDDDGCPEDICIDFYLELIRSEDVDPSQLEQK